MNILPNDRLQRIARNINAMDTYYQYIDGRKWEYWNRLNGTIHKVLGQLTDADKAALIPLCEENKAKFFNLV